MAFRVSFFFIQASGRIGGWSENFWSSLTDLTTCQVKAASLKNLLNNLTGAQAYCARYRISDANTFRNVITVELNTAGPQPVGSGNPDADYPSTALQLELRGAPNYKTNQWLRGLPDSVTTTSGTYNPPGYFLTAMSALIAELTSGSNQWSLNVLNVAVVPKLVSGLTNAGVVTCLGHGFATGARVRIKGFKGITGANRVWSITNLTVDTFSLNLYTPPVGFSVVPGTPTARLQTYIQPQISGGRVVRVTSHKTGRPTGLLGGRRRTRRT